MFNNYKILQLKNCSNPKVKDFVLKNHYSGSLPRGSKFVFVLILKNKIKGVAAFGTPVGNRCQKYSTGKGEVVELKRFCLAPGAPKNTASWMIAKCIKVLKGYKTVDTILSYADPEAGHEGVIYKASNFRYLGQSKKGQAIIMKGKTIHLRAAYQKVEGKYTKTAEEVKLGLKTGQAKYISLQGKHVYVYNLRR